MVRHGYALIEMVVLVSVFGSLMVLAAISLQRSFHVQKLALQTIRHQRALQDLQIRLRRDIYRADADRIQNSEEFFLFVNDSKDKVTRYFFDNDSIVRETLSPEGQVLGRQTWPLSVRSVATVMEWNDAAPLIHISVELHPERCIGVPVEFSLISRVGVEADDQ